MAIDLTQFHDAFFDESFEALDSMESTLLTLTVGSPEPESVNAIFRVAHSIKGGGATFGFGEIASFTHSLETLLDELRGRRILVTQRILDLLLKSVDVMRAMLGAAKAKRPFDAQSVADLQFDIELIMVQRDTGIAASPSPATATIEPNAAAAAPAEAPQIIEWLIDLRPGPQFFERGTDPVRIFRELGVLGNLLVTAHLDALPCYQDIEPGRCYLSWSLSLVSDAPEAAIREIFEWVNADCELTISAGDSVVAAAPPALDSAADAGIATPAARIPAAPTSPVAAQHGAAGAMSVAPTQTGAAVESGSIRVGVEKVDELINTVGEL